AIDLGCGTGSVTARLAELGWSISGADGAEAACTMREAGFPFETNDLGTPVPEVVPMFDTVVCTETAEHIAAESSEHVVAHVVRRARHWIVWSAARPGQFWPGHVNLQPAEYWLAKFAARGWVTDDVRTASLRREMIERAAQHHQANDNFYVLQAGLDHE